MRYAAGWIKNVFKIGYSVNYLIRGYSRTKQCPKGPLNGRG